MQTEGLREANRLKTEAATVGDGQRAVRVQ